MTSVMEPVSGVGPARAYLRSNPLLMALLFGGIPALTVIDDRWPFPVLHPWSLLVLAAVAAVATIAASALWPRRALAPVG